jgi:CubicO group peptidase (beta-lactamase class C family)
MLLLLVISSSCSGQSFRSLVSLDDFTEYLDTRIPQLMDRYGIPGVSMALVLEGELMWSNAYGFADLEYERKMTIDAVCRAESISKPVTAWGVMRLVEQGLVDLDARVQGYLGDWEFPETAYDEQAITVRMLLSHSSGLSLGTIGKAVEYAPQSDMLTLQDFLTHEALLFQDPGSGFTYSDTGFNLLELLVEEVTGRDFAAYMAEEVLLPLDMYNSSFEWDESFKARIPNGYELHGATVLPYVYPVRASGGLFADVKDIALFVAAGMTEPGGSGQRLLERERLDTLYMPQIEIPGIFGVVAESYGFGHFIETLPDGRQAVWHGGQGHGWMTHFHFVPESGDGIIILTNSQRSWPFMAEVLRDWAQWSGLGAVKFVRITYATTVLWALIGLVLLASMFLLYALLRDLFNKSRQFAPLSRRYLIPRLTTAALGMGVIIALLWSAEQPYLMVTSIFPGAAGWAGTSLFILAGLMILLAFFPRNNLTT